MPQTQVQFSEERSLKQTIKQIVSRPDRVLIFYGYLFQGMVIDKLAKGPIYVIWSKTGAVYRALEGWMKLAFNNSLSCFPNSVILAV